MDKGTEKPEKGGKTELLLLVMIFIAPILVAWLVFNYTDIGRGGSGSYGALVEPPVQIPDLSLGVPVSGRPAGRLHGRWSLMYLSPEDCGQVCQESLFMMQHLKASLVMNADRLQLIVVLNSGPTLLLPDGLREGFNWGNTHTLAAEEISRFIEHLDEARGGLAGNFLLVDPAGNLMMRYTEGSEGSGILQDIKRLLRYSRAG